MTLNGEIYANCLKYSQLCFNMVPYLSQVFILLCEDKAGEIDSIGHVIFLIIVVS